MTDNDGLLVARIVIERRLTGDGDEVHATFEDGNGDVPGVVELLGMLELTKDTALRATMGNCGDDCTCDEDDPQ